MDTIRYEGQMGKATDYLTPNVDSDKSDKPLPISVANIEGFD
jgi:hypothetical protein